MTFSNSFERVWVNEHGQVRLSQTQEGHIDPRWKDGYAVGATEEGSGRIGMPYQFHTGSFGALSQVAGSKYMTTFAFDWRVHMNSPLMNSWLYVADYWLVFMPRGPEPPGLPCLLSQTRSH